MKFALFTYPDPDYAAHYDNLPDDVRQAEIDEHNRWFAKHRDRIRGGTELAWPKVARTVRRRGGEPVITDGPFVEGKEILGGVIVVEAGSMDEAVAMAAEWPALQQGPGAGVQVEAVMER